MSQGPHEISQPIRTFEGTRSWTHVGNQDPTHVERFKREADILAQLNSPNIIKIYDAYLTGDSKFLVLEKFEGQNLKSLIAESGTLTWETIEKIAVQILNTLIACHEIGVIHRDLKPQNILVNKKLEIRLLDFGISRPEWSISIISNVAGSMRASAIKSSLRDR